MIPQSLDGPAVGMPDEGVTLHSVTVTHHGSTHNDAPNLEWSGPTASLACLVGQNAPEQRRSTGLDSEHGRINVVDVPDCPRL